MRWFWSSPEAPSTAARDTSEPRSLLQSFTSPDVLLPTAILTTGILGVTWVWRSRLRRIPSANAVPESYLRARSIWGKVVSVGDADNFRVYHTPGGVLAGFASLRPIPKERKELMAQTIHVRVAGIDAPEAAHFGRPAQPYAQESMDRMKSLVDGRYVRVYLYRKDQYERVVGQAYTRRFGIPGLPRAWMSDVGLGMLRAGCATVYEAKMGAEFGGPAREKVYRAAEERAKKSGKGMWGGGKGGVPVLGRLTSYFRGQPAAAEKFESPREYKNRMKTLEGAEAAQTKTRGNAKH